MSHSERHRGPKPKDDQIFSEKQLPKIRHALSDLCWLLSNGYVMNSSLKLVGDRFVLTARQRMLLRRSACDDVSRDRRKARSITAGSLNGQEVFIDGFNLLITIESAMSGGFIFVGVDGSYRDMSSIHGSYKRVQETEEGIRLVGRFLANAQVKRVHWLLDEPVSNSGRLKVLLAEIAEEENWDWNIELVKSPDAVLKIKNGISITTDSVILDAVDQWFNLSQCVIEESIPNANVIGLS
jgi:hypothetical protein